MSVRSVIYVRELIMQQDLTIWQTGYANKAASVPTGYYAMVL